MRIALAQINSFLGDFAGNKAKIMEYIHRAHGFHCDMVVFPEAALFGYHPADLLERPSIVAQQEAYLKQIATELPKGMGAFVGAIVKNTSKKGKSYWNAAVFLEKGKKPQIFPKQLLPTYDVFDESRHIESGDTSKNILKFKGKKMLVTICEDIWGWPRKNNPGFANYGQNPLLKAPRKGFDLIVNLSASPFTETKFKNRRIVTKCTATHFKCPMVYVNMVGAQDELIFDGGSFAIDKTGKVRAQCVRFAEDMNIFELESLKGTVRELPDNPQEILREALVMGLREFAQKTGFKKVHLGLSGGVDSALVACLAADAFGPLNVTTIYLPGPYSSVDSEMLAKKLAENLGIKLLEFPISDMYAMCAKQVDQVFGDSKFGLTHENIQARLRGLALMAYSNREPSMLLGTTNKSELAVGYGTMYGDLIGGVMPIADLLKGEVYQLCRHYNSESEIIPEKILTRAPSAELRPNQTDQDSLPPYDELDAAVRSLVEGFNVPKNETEKKILSMMMKSEFKRWQAPPVLKVSDHAFGRGRRFPVAHKAGV
jgi:NAD+ synthase (glutamine-hydrolysing)